MQILQFFIKKSKYQRTMFPFFSQGFYYAILLIQGFCLFHAYKNQTQQKWFYLIIFLPGIGSLIYLYENFYNRNNLENIGEGLKSTIFSNYALEKLEKEAKVSGTVTNKMLLADAYFGNGRNTDAIKWYESCLNKIGANSPDLLRKLLKSYFVTKNYDKVVQLGRELGNDKQFKASEEKICFAWALYFTDNIAEAEEKFKEMDASFSNFRHRLEFSKFLVTNTRTSEAKQKLKKIMEEYEAMGSYEQSLKRNELRDVKNYLKSIK
jgi:hypothetical protein